MSDLSQTFFGISSIWDDSEESRLVKENMDALKKLSVTELTFRKKYDEINSLEDSFINNSYAVKAKIWKPTDINDEQQTIKELEQLNPIVEIVSNESSEYDWLQVRTFCHS